MKRILAILMVIAMISVTTICGFAGTGEDGHFDVMDEKGLHTTMAVLVQDGIAYSLTEEEYESLDFIEGEESLSFEEESFGEIGIMPLNSVYYKFIPSSISKALSSSDKRRVSALYENAFSVRVTEKVSFTRKIVETGGLTVTTAIKNIIDTKVEATYSVKKTASSSTSTTVTGTFKPSGKYTYSAIVFTPRIGTIKGECQFRQSWDGSDTLLSKYSMTLKYPCVTSSGICDGVYALKESNSTSGFPD